MPGGPHPFACRGRAAVGQTAPELTGPSQVTGIRLNLFYALVSAAGSPTPNLTVVGTLPPGVSFGQYPGGLGLFGGTPTTVGTWPITVHATNIAGTDDLPITFTIDPQPNPATLIPPEIDASGATDVTGALQAFFDGLPDGTSAAPKVIEFPAGADYRVDGTLLLEDRSHLVLDASAGARIFAGTDGSENPSTQLTRSQLRLNRCDHVVIYGLEIEGANHPAGVTDANFYSYTTGGISGTGSYVAQFEQQHALDLKGCTEIEVSHCDFHHTFGDTIYMGRDLGPAPHRVCDGVWIHHCDLHHAGRQLIGGGAIHRLIAEWNTLRDGRRTVVDIEPLGTDLTVWRGTDVFVIDNQIGNHWLNFFSNKGNSPNCDTIVVARNTAIGIGKCKHVIYLGSVTLTDPSQPGYPGWRRTNYWIVDNDASLSSQDHDLITAQRIDGLVVHGDTSPTQAGFPFATTSYCSARSIHDNTIAPSTIQNSDTGSTAGTPISETPPAPPDVAGRSTGGYVP